MLNGPEQFAGRKIGVLVTDGTDAKLLQALRKAATAEGALVELVAPWIGGVTTSDGELVPAHQKVDGGPSVLYDAIAVLPSADGAAALAQDPAAKDFVTDAHAHGKFVAYHPDAMPLLQAAGVDTDLDDGYIALDKRDAIDHLHRTMPSAALLGSRRPRRASGGRSGHHGVLTISDRPGRGLTLPSTTTCDQEAR